MCVLVAKLCPTLVIPWTVPARLLCPWDSPGKNTGVGCHFLLQGIFPTQESNPSLLHCRQIIYQLSCAAAAAKSLHLCPTLCDPRDSNPLGSSVHGIFQARVLEWVAISFSRGFSRPRDRTRVSCIVDRQMLYHLSHQGSHALS